jgi:F0F1-type ATP synthase epsilon subunit
MQSCELVATITAIACAIANNCSEEEVAVLSSAFNQLGDTLVTIIAQQSFNEQKCSDKNDNKSDNDQNFKIKNTKNNQKDCYNDADD